MGCLGSRLQGKTNRGEIRRRRAVLVARQKPFVRFGIESATNAWCADEEKYIGPGRHAHIYVFALNTQQDRDLAALLDENDWQFFVLPVSKIDELFGCQKQLGLAPLSKCAQPVTFHEIKGAVDELLLTYTD